MNAIRKTLSSAFLMGLLIFGFASSETWARVSKKVYIQGLVGDFDQERVQIILKKGSLRISRSWLPDKQNLVSGQMLRLKVTSNQMKQIRFSGKEAWKF